MWGGFSTLAGSAPGSGLGLGWVKSSGSRAVILSLAVICPLALITVSCSASLFFSNSVKLGFLPFSKASAILMSGLPHCFQATGPLPSLNHFHECYSILVDQWYQQRGMGSRTNNKDLYSSCTQLPEFQKMLDNPVLLRITARGKREEKACASAPSFI